ncbi:hypothetical protein [Psychrobacter aestuarii]|uniref:Uncharacterized protein n=1 Tax=Psychrobacter aestuarii TaxID=556327 RepID=A0ABN0VJK5_9GAMM|nr:hypothetical protein [Psychrobacter aestuarii]
MRDKGLEKILPAISNRSNFLDDYLPAKEGGGYFGRSLVFEIDVLFIFKNEELCATHQVAYMQLLREFESLDNDFEKLHRKAREIKEKLGEGASVENFEYAYHQQLKVLHGQENFLNSIKSFTDQHFVVGLRALVEQNLAKVLNIYKEKTDSNFGIPYSWDKIIALLSSLNVNTDQNLPVYKNTNELRVLNNKIKHLNEVDSRLAEFFYFQDKQGEDLDKVNLELQRYADYAYAFLVFIGEQLHVEKDK